MRFAILGPLEVHDGDGPVSLGGGQQRKLLAVLLLHRNEAVSGDRLVGELWGDTPPDTAVKALQGYVSQLRKRLGADAVETMRSGYRLRVDEEDLDSSRFEGLLAGARTLDRAPAAAQLRAALALWRGPALADFAYDEFAQSEISRLEELRLSCIERRIDLELALGHHDDLVPELEALVRAHPLRELFRRHLMVALYRCGRQADALEAYRDARTTLRDELGLEPSETLKMLEKAILEHDPSIAAPPRVEVPPDGEAVVPSDAPGWRPQRRMLVGVGSALLAAAAAAALALTLGGGKSPRMTVPADSAALFDAKHHRIAAYVGVGRRPIGVAVGEGGVWVTNADDGTVSRLDPVTGRLVRTIGVGADVNGIATGFGAVWIADGNDGTITRIDPRVNQIERTIAPSGLPTIATNPIFFVAVGDRYVWVTQGNQLLRIDPSTNEVTGRAVVGAATGLAAGGGAVWVTTLAQRLVRVDPASLRRTADLALPSTAAAVVYAKGSVWLILAPDAGGLQRLDSVTLTPTSVPLEVRDPTALAAGGGAVWAADPVGFVQQVGGSASAVRAVLAPGGQLTALAVGSGRVWLAVGAI
jgi:DNA-binding SARP family transcriptional activator/streptogramin lyase